MSAENGNMGYTIGLDFNRWKNNAERLVTYKEDMKRAMQDTVAMKDAINQCWSGKSKDEFVKKLDEMIRIMSEQIDGEYSVLASRMADIVNFYVSQDQSLLETL